MSGLWREIEEKFAFRRAFRFGFVSTADYKEAFDMPLKTAERRFADALDSSDPLLRGLLRREGRKLVPAPAAMAPAFAQEADFSDTLRGLRSAEARRFFFALTGLRESEAGLPALAPIDAENIMPGLLALALKAIGSRQVLEIGFFSDAQSPARPCAWRVAPLGFSMDADQAALRVFEIARYDDALGAWVPAQSVRSVPLSRIACAAPVLDARSRPVVYAQAIFEPLATQGFELGVEAKV